MLRSFTRYTHVPLAAVSVLLLLAVIVWLLARRGDSLWAPGSTPPVVAIPPAVSPTAPASSPSTATAPNAEASPEPPGPRQLPGSSLRAPTSTTRYVLESGPFTSAATADQVEDQLNRLGYATVRFRKQDLTRVFVVAATGFASTEEAKHAARQLGRGTVTESDGTAEVVVDRLPTLGQAVAAARPLRARGFEVRVSEAVSPAVIYHIRYGQFERRSDAEALGKAVAGSGIKSRVAKVR